MSFKTTVEVAFYSGRHCRACPWRMSGYNNTKFCAVFGEASLFRDPKAQDTLRCEACLRAEKKYHTEELPPHLRGCHDDG